MYGGKAIIKYNPSSDEVLSGIRQNATLFTYQSPDGLPHYVTIDVGRLSSGLGGPGSDGGPGAAAVTNGAGGGSFPLGQDAAGNTLTYRATAQILIGTPGSMQDPFYIDINRGQRFTALASYVAVTVQMNAPPIDEITGLPLVLLGTIQSGSMAVYATLGPAVAPSLAPVLFTQYVDLIAPPIGPPLAAQFSRIIPPRANLLFPIQSSNISGTISLSLKNVSGQNVATPPAVAAGASQALVIPEDAYSVFVAPSVFPMGAPVAWRLVYQLSV